MSKCAGVVLLVVALLWTKNAPAIAPPYISDEELAALPIIVVAKWDKAAFERHDEYVQDEAGHRGIVRLEAYTKVHVLRTVKGGPIAAGEHDLMVGCGISWRKDGTWLTSGTSTEMLGDVQDITKPNLWFLERARSWDKDRKDEYLSIDNYRRIQPIALEKYFIALASARRETAVPDLLTPDQPEVAMRVLRYISGGIWPWPYDPDEFDQQNSNPEQRGRILREEAVRVWAIVNSEAREPRPYAVSVYAELKGKDCLTQMRTLLNDKDPLVRGIAIGVLLRHQDAASLENIETAIRGVDEGWLACKLIEALSSWGDERVVPCLITYLQNCQLGIPALKSRHALKKITGHWFPFDVSKSTDAWQQARKVSDKLKRKELLEKLIPGEEFPFVAELVGQPTYKDADPENRPGVQSSRTATARDDGPAPERTWIASVRLRNITDRPIVIAKYPSEVEMSDPGGVATSEFDVEKPTTDKFAKVAPGDSVEFEVELRQFFLTAEPNTRSLKVSYRQNGNDVGVNAWIGALEVRPGTDWKEKHAIEKVEETWPNGNLRVTGTTVNGQKVGKWNYFNEQGDRIKIDEYHGGKLGGTATCNPEHPNNKGAGMRAKKE